MDEIVTFDRAVLFSEPWRERKLIEIRRKIGDFVSTDRISTPPILNWENIKKGRPKWG